MAKFKRLTYIDEIPQKWYNIKADLDELPPPPLNPATQKPLSPDDLKPIFPVSLIEQEATLERFIEIPDPVRNAYSIWRPSPLVYAANLREKLGLKAHIFYKYEGVSPTGSHKPNTAVAQAYYNKIEGVKKLTTETGAGQWGSALAFSGSLFDLHVKVFMVKVSYMQKPGRRIFIQSYGGEIVPSPSDQTPPGRKILEEDPDNPGSLGIAITEAVYEAVNDPEAKYSLGSVLDHVLMHQTVIGLEAIEQFKKLGVEPEILIGCVGGGSNFGGFVFPFIGEYLRGERKKVRAVAVEPTACPTLTKGKYDYDYGDTGKLTPMLKMFTLGHDFMPPSIHAGGLRYHGMSPLVSLLHRKGLVEARAYDQLEIFEAAIQFARAEGILPAPESAHAVKAAIDIAREVDDEVVIAFNLSGHGYFDLSAYDAYLKGELK